MSDPEALPDQPKTPRAPPLQPDKPVGGADPQRPSRDAEAPAEAARRQSENALENVREGYGGGQPSTP